MRLLLRNLRTGALGLLALLAFTGCRDAAAPAGDRSPPGPQFRTAFTGVNVLQQAPTAPPLEAYRVSFWAFVGESAAVTVKYQPAAGDSVGQPFLRFAIPRNGLLAGMGGGSLKVGDSVSITVTIDSVAFAVDFEPSGLVFATQFPANLSISYANADPDLNGDGVVNGRDKQLEKELAIWYRGTTWSKQSSKADTTQLSVSGPLYHFSQYAVAW
jgi:hypothetical protein